MTDCIAFLCKIIAPVTATSRLAIPLFLTGILILSPLGCGSNSSAGGDGADSTQVAENDSTDAGDDKAGSEDEGEDNKKKRKKREKTISVNATKAVRGDLVVPVVAEGAIRARRTTELRSLIEGRIEKILVREGQTVRKGQILARFDNRESLVALEEARSKYLEALGRLAADDETIDPILVTEQLEARITELERMEAEGTITARERSERVLSLEIEAMKEGAYRGELVKVRSGLSTARAAQDRAELDLENTEIRAPFSGVISNLTLTTGEWVNDNQFFCKLIDNLNLEAEVAVLESDLAGLEPGRRAILELPALGDTIHVTVDVMSPEIDSESRTCQLLLRFKNVDRNVRPGMFVRASIAGEIYPGRLMVPREAVITRDGRPLVFKIVNNRAQWVYIKTGLSNDQVIEVEKVLQGGPLDDGTLVVISDHLTLTHEAKVKVKKVHKMEFAFAPSSQED